MNRKILFKALNANNEWVYGLPRLDPQNKTSYYEQFNYRMTWLEDNAECSQPIKNGTLCQYTGLKDKNGKMIFEGDIIRTYANYGYGKSVKKVEVISQVIYKVDKDKTISGLNTNNFSGFTTKQLNKQDYTNVDWSMFFQCEVIGNIYESKINE